MEVKLDSDNFKAEVVESPIPVLVDFWAEWCMPCHAIAPAVAEIAEKYKGRLKVGKLNVDDHPQIASDYHVVSIPNLKIFKSGKIVDELIGTMPKTELVKHVEKHL
jgi:thioredoxin 1